MVRLVVAAGLLAVVGFVTLTSVRRVGTTINRGRLEDRVAVAQAFTAPLDTWLAGAQAAASKLATGGTPGGWDTLRVDAGGKLAGGAGYGGLSGEVGRLPACAQAGRLADLVVATTAAQYPVAAAVVPPGPCDVNGRLVDPVIGAGARAASGGVAIVTADASAFLAQVSLARQFPADIRTLVIDPNGTALSPDGSSQRARPSLTTFVRTIPAGKTRVAELSRPSVVDVGAALPSVRGWSVVIEQGTSRAPDKPTNGPSRTQIVVVALFFAALLGLQAFWDYRRRAAARVADAHTAAFLAVLGHELRTPLTVIKGFADTLANRWDRLNDTQRHEIVGRLPQQTRRLSRVVERLVLAANLQSGSSERPGREPVDVGAVLERVASEFRPVAPLHEFVVEADPTAVVRGDDKTLDRIVDQLVDNAVKYSPAGGVVRMTAVRRAGRVDVTVEDEGVGLPKNVDAIFDPFVQGEAVEGRVHDEGGVGVGLSIVRTLCEQLGGSVRAEPRTGSGSRFVATLPAWRVRIAMPV